MIGMVVVLTMVTASCMKQNEYVEIEGSWNISVDDTFIDIEDPIALAPYTHVCLAVPQEWVVEHARDGLAFRDSLRVGGRLVTSQGSVPLNNPYLRGQRTSPRMCFLTGWSDSLRDSFRIEQLVFHSNTRVRVTTVSIRSSFEL